MLLFIGLLISNLLKLLLIKLPQLDSWIHAGSFYYFIISFSMQSGQMYIV